MAPFRPVSVDYQANESGQACGKCDSCWLRAEDFEAAGVVDQTHYY